MSTIEHKPHFTERGPRDHDSLLNAPNQNGMSSGIEFMCLILPTCLPWKPCSMRETEIQYSLSHSLIGTFTEMTTRREINDNDFLMQSLREF